MANKSMHEFNGKTAKYAYSKLSSLAKDHGGPEDLINDTYENGYADGRRDSYTDSDYRADEEPSQDNSVFFFAAGAAAVIGLKYLFDKGKQGEEIANQHQSNSLSDSDDVQEDENVEPVEVDVDKETNPDLFDRGAQFAGNLTKKGLIAAGGIAKRGLDTFKEAAEETLVDGAAVVGEKYCLMKSNIEKKRESQTTKAIEENSNTRKMPSLDKMFVRRELK